MAAAYTDQAYLDAGANIVPDAASAVAAGDILFKIQRPMSAEEGVDELGLLRPGQTLMAPLGALTNKDLVQALASKGVMAFALELIPRITRAQSMDALSSMSTIAGYRGALLAADNLPKFFPMFMTAAGTVFAARVLVIGAGVAGLQAIATARRLGAQVWGYDVRPVVKEQVESLGAKFLAFDLGVADAEDKGGYAKALSADASRKQQDMLAEKTKDFDVVITTALVPGKPAPRLITKETVAAMRPGSVIVDLAAESGGNCELSKPDEVVVAHGVSIHGPTNLPATMPVHASQLYARNVTELLNTFVKNGELALDFTDEVIAGACVTHAGDVVSEAVKATLAAGTTA